MREFVWFPSAVVGFIPIPPYEVYDIPLLCGWVRVYLGGIVVVNSVVDVAPHAIDLVIIRITPG